jgi:hypothetical protein
MCVYIYILRTHARTHTHTHAHTQFYKKTALELAEERGHSAVVAVLKEHTASGGRK